MLFEPNAIITESTVLRVDFQKSKSIWAPGRRFHSLSFRLSGKVSIEWAGNVLFSSPGSLTFLPQNFSYSTSVMEPGEIIVIHFTCLQEYPDLLPLVVSPDQPKIFETHFKTLLERYQTGTNPDYACMSLIYHILADFDSQLIHSRHFIPSRMTAAKQTIDRNFHLPLTIPELAFAASVSETYFRKEFKECFGLSPASYLKKVRIENAKALLLAGYYQVSEVATRCGFDSISYFSYEFHRQTGMTPSEYKEGI